MEHTEIVYRNNKKHISSTLSKQNKAITNFNEEINNDRKIFYDYFVNKLKNFEKKSNETCINKHFENNISCIYNQNILTN